MGERVYCRRAAEDTNVGAQAPLVVDQPGVEAREALVEFLQGSAHARACDLVLSLAAGVAVKESRQFHDHKIPW